MKLTSTDILNHFNIDLDIEEFPILGLSDNVTKLENTISFIEGNIQTLFGDHKNSIILVTELDESYFVEGINSILIKCEFRDFIKLINKFKLRLISNLELTPYTKVLKNSKILSKTAKIYNAIIGNNCSFHHNVLVGVDSYLKYGDVEVPSMGHVIIGDNVQVFNNSIINRGFLGFTEIGNNVVIENNCEIGSNVKIGNNCRIKSGSIICNNVRIEDNTVVEYMSLIRESY